MYDETFYRALRLIDESRGKTVQSGRPCERCNKACPGVCEEWNTWFKEKWNKTVRTLRLKWGYYIDRSDGA